MVKFLHPALRRGGSLLRVVHHRDSHGTVPDWTIGRYHDHRAVCLVVIAQHDGVKGRGAGGLFGWRWGVEDDVRALGFVVTACFVFGD